MRNRNPHKRPKEGHKMKLAFILLVSAYLMLLGCVAVMVPYAKEGYDARVVNSARYAEKWDNQRIMTVAHEVRKIEKSELDDAINAAPLPSKPRGMK